MPMSLEGLGLSLEGLGLYRDCNGRLILYIKAKSSWPSPYQQQSMANSTLLSLTFLIFCFLFLRKATSFNSKTDLLSLLAFKSGLNDPQQSLNSWNQSTHFCNWTGIVCGRKHPNRVVGIDLMSRGLIGTLSPHVGNLSFLKTIILQNNTFHGQIPPEISLLRRLRYVELSNNSFSGTIPRNLSQCPNLVYLNLIDNHLSGTIPPEFGICSKLQELGLSINKLSGSIPHTIGNITFLEALSLDECGLQGEIPATLAQLLRLIYLELGFNNLTGIIPSGLFNLSAIGYFDVSNNQLYGVLPSTLGLQHPILWFLGFSYNNFSGSIPASISNASEMEGLFFFSNHFTGLGPKTLGSLTKLRHFVCSSNLIEDDIGFISTFVNSTYLETLDLGDNLITGSLPDSIGNLSHQLRWLSLGSNKIHGKIPSTIGNLIGLTVIYLAENYLEGPIPASISELSKLQFFSVSANRFTNELPSSLGNLTLLNELYLDGNNFVGNLPASISNCTMLLQLDLSRNNFSGHIPPEILSISSISIALNLSNNVFDGSIPNEIGSLKNLGALDLSYNRLSGSIPYPLNQCLSLETLLLTGNFLEGEIPSSLSALMGLRNLDLSRNNLSGPIPTFLSKVNLEFLNLSFNRLQGEVPTIGIFKNTTSVSLDGNKELCGGIVELKLPPCIRAKPHKKSLWTLLKILVPILVGGIIFLVLVAAFIYTQIMSRKNVTWSLPSLTGFQIMRLSYGDLLKATDGFSEAKLVGLGRFGSVYKGILDDGGITVAVKVFNIYVRGASKSFMAECNALRNVRHRNLVKILSVCESIDFQGNEFKALVYEFKDNGNLEKWLHTSTKEGEENVERNNLNMIQRVNIAIDIAEAIEYLHTGTESSIVHGDLKPSNILLDEDMTAYVGDFGLAKFISGVDPSQESNNSTVIRGTIGYVPPEYGTNRLVSRQGDVYSYGIMLLEMFTNKRPTDDTFGEDVNLHTVVSAALPDRVMEVVDSKFHTPMSNDSIRKCITSILSIGVSCSKEMARERMSMTDVVNELHKIQKLLSRTR